MIRVCGNNVTKNDLATSRMQIYLFIKFNLVIFQILILFIILVFTFLFKSLPGFTLILNKYILYFSHTDTHTNVGIKQILKLNNNHERIVKTSTLCISKKNIESVCRCFADLDISLLVCILTAEF